MDKSGPITPLMAKHAKFRGWCFTLQIKLEWSKAKMERVRKCVENIPGAIYTVFQLETAPTTGQVRQAVKRTDRTLHALKNHLQGYLYFKNGRTMKGVKRLFGTLNPHLEGARGTPQDNLTYCTKLEGRVTGDSSWTFTRGSLPTQGARMDVAALLIYSKTHTISDCWTEHPVDMSRYYRAVIAMKAAVAPVQNGMPVVKVIVGGTGSGKTHLAMMEASEATDVTGDTVGPHEVFHMMSPTGKNVIPWLDGYTGQDHVVIEDLGVGQINFRILLRMLDKWPNKMQIKGGTVEFSPKKIWITTNIHPKKWYPIEEPEDTWGTGPLARRVGKITKLEKRELF